jgi:hypothetical protein
VGIQWLFSGRVGVCPLEESGCRPFGEVRRERERDVDVRGESFFFLFLSIRIATIKLYT